MEVKSFTYKNLAGTYYRQTAFSSEKMDDHIAKMLGDGWEMANPPAISPGDGRTFGPFVKRDTMTIIFKKA